jgi:hypothetical protein
MVSDKHRALGMQSSMPLSLNWVLGAAGWNMRFIGAVTTPTFSSLECTLMI